MKRKHIHQEMNQEQDGNILKIIDASQSEVVKESIFRQLGHQLSFSPVSYR
jgi:hypothetical protein